MKRICGKGVLSSERKRVGVTDGESGGEGASRPR